MKRWLLIALVLTTAVSCGSKKKDGAAGKNEPGKAASGPGGADTSAAHADSTATLWAFAPEGAVFGMVVGDGVPVRARGIARAIIESAAARPFGAHLTAMLHEGRKDIGFDPLDDAGWKSVGIDPSKGAAMFVSLGKDGKEHPVMVLAVTDRAAFRAKTEGKTDTIDGREVDKIRDDMVCAPVADRYFCAKNLVDLDLAAKPHDSKLAGVVKALPAESRGDFELYGDLASIPQASEQLAEFATKFGKIDATGLTIRLESDGFTLRLWAKGNMNGPVAQALLASPPRADLVGKTGNAATVLRFKSDPRMALADAPASMPLAGVDFRTDFLDQLTGDMQFVSVGKGLVAGTLVFGIEDTAKVTGAIKAACAVGKASIGQKDVPISKLDLGDKGCKGELAFAKLEKEIGFAAPKMPFALEVDGKLLVLAIGDVDPARLAGNAADDAGSAETKAMLGGPMSVVAWSRSIDVDVEALPGKLVAELKKDDHVALALDALAWLAANVYEIGVGMTVSPTDASVVFRVTTFAGDPAEARSAYAAALAKRSAGDRPGYAAALAELAKKFAGTRVGRRAKLESEGAPVLGPGTALIAGGVAAYLVAHVARGLAVEALPPTPPEAPPPPAQPPAGIKPGFGGDKKPAAPGHELKAPPSEELKAPPQPKTP